MVISSIIFHLISLTGLFGLSVYGARWPEYGTLKTTNSSGIMNVTINNTFSTINLFDFHFQSDLANLIETLQSNNTGIRVVIFSSGNKDFFLSHADLSSFLPAHADSPLPLFDPARPDVLFVASLVWNITTLPQATIAVIEGRARGGGNEFLMACDMRFATLSPSVQLAQMETSFGLNAGAGGALQLSRLIGLGRAFEYVFSSKDIDAKTAEQYGWINRAFPTSVEMNSYVQSLAQRIALFPVDGIVASKTGMNAFSRPDLATIVKDAQDKIAALTPEMVSLATKFVEITGNQSIGKVELDYGDELFALYNGSESKQVLTSRGCHVLNMPYRVC